MRWMTVICLVLGMGLVACAVEEAKPAAEAKASDPAAVEAIAPSEVPADQPLAAPAEGPAAPAGEAAAEGQAPAEHAAEIAMFKVPDTSAPAVKQLVGALADDKGTVSAQVNAEQGTLDITFKPGPTNPRTLLAALNTVEPTATFVGVKPAGDAAAKSPAHNCGSCPSKDSCGKH